MSWGIAIVALVAAGLALLDLLRLRTGRAVPDVALGWLAGTGWLAAVAPPVRFALGIPLGRVTLAVLLVAPIAVWTAVAASRRRRGAPPSPPRSGGEGRDEGVRGKGEHAVPRWLPRPLWLFAPMAGYVLVVTVAVLLHGSNMPTQTDDGVRIRAFAPILAYGDAWEPAARAVFAQAGPLVTFVPAVAWIVTGTVDHFHVNYAILTELVALLALVVGLASARGAPERGWVGAFAVLSVPLFVYHCTSTYSDAVLAMRVAGGVLLALEYARTRDRSDLARALLLVGIAALVKREGELVAAAPAGVLLAQIAWERWRERRAVPWASVALLLAPGLLAAVGKIAALGLAGAFPMLGFVAQQAAVAAGTGGGAARPVGMEAQTAALFVDQALFRSGNQGMLWWILAGVLAVRGRAILRGALAWPLLAVAGLLAEVAVNSIFIIPQFTLDQGTVNRALLVAGVPAALWVGAALVEAVRAEAAAGAPADAARASPGKLRGRRRASGGTR